MSDDEELAPVGRIIQLAPAFLREAEALTQVAARLRFVKLPPLDDD